MNFFERQEEARRSTRKLVGLFALAVFLIVLAVYLAVALAVTWAENLDLDVWNLTVFGWVAAVTLTVIVVGTLYKIATLRGGGQAVGRLLGGRRRSPESCSPTETWTISSGCSRCASRPPSPCTRPRGSGAASASTTRSTGPSSASRDR